ncbi:MAG: plasmid replication initiator TrfA [Nitrosomonadales bacterium]
MLEEVSVTSWTPTAMHKPTRRNNNSRQQHIKAWMRGDQLPLWPEEIRCAPNEFLRSALFNARNRNQPRRYLRQESLAIIGKGRITYTGEELRQDDATVWLQLIQMASDTTLGAVVEFTPYSFCKAVGWTPSGETYAHLRKCLTRLQATALAFYAERTMHTISLSMIPAFCWQDESTGKPLPHYQVKLAPELAALFHGQHFTYLHWAQRRQLPEGLATWLHGYLSSHKQPRPLALEEIQRAADLTISRSDNLRKVVINALNALLEAEFLVSWQINGNHAVVVRR